MYNRFYSKINDFFFFNSAINIKSHILQDYVFSLFFFQSRYIITERRLLLRPLLTICTQISEYLFKRDLISFLLNDILIV